MSLALRLAEAKYASALAEDAVWRRAADGSERTVRVLPREETELADLSGTRIATGAVQLRLRASDVDQAGGPPRAGDRFTFSGRSLVVFGQPRPWGARRLEWVCEVAP